MGLGKVLRRAREHDSRHASTRCHSSQFPSAPAALFRRMPAPRLLLFAGRLSHHMFSDWRWLLLGCLSLEAPSWQWTLTVVSTLQANGEPRPQTLRQYPVLVGCQCLVVSVNVVGHADSSSVLWRDTRSVPPLRSTFLVVPPGTPGARGTDRFVSASHLQV